MRYDIIGCGTVMQQVHVPVIRVLSEHHGVTIAGCYDRDPVQARRAATLSGAERWGTRAAPRDGDGVDAALVATPPSSHGQIAAEYIRSGKSVLVEKPMTASASEARELVDEARRHGVSTAVDHFWRFYPSVNVARRFLGDKLDRISSVEAAEGFRWDWSPVSNYVTEDPYGGVIGDTGSHLIDMVLYVLGLDRAPEEVSFELAELDKVPPSEPSHECRARLTLTPPESHSLGIDVTISRLRPLARGVKVRGDFGLLFIPCTFAGAPILFQGERGFRLRSAEPEAEPPDEFGCLLMLHLEFLGAQRDRGLPNRVDASRFLLLSQILESMHEGGLA